ncbi:cyclopropane-fatty-acyl-phospholipid synthase family protein [Accumulibacter sp.]|uniref:SAM-dependent methyltransferase n=1 Tax=Accumulibacter sp. TaxID=2053492 RepID=UPI0025E08FF2|nr:cyclopropane-fatty-acyl-phospholipid synthase family protein [Accumulibacter sp.]MCM8594805.1 cyclopropane-fatty-acyl-phospholipid synthase family protein [Accumulibacter sp.]MCM8625090.1 cyclopropane-fatty-acyl-phospholipid synthase family protein [Accumulibacter sp.]MDS4048950.1 cyclopropane-fatty-acyl-phospholipid synthase family protein [Accumulibacter sp.]
MLLEARLTHFLQQRQSQEIPLRLQLWNGQEVVLGPEPRVTLRLSSPAAIPALVAPSLNRLAEAYFDGLIEIDGRLGDVIHVADQLTFHGRHRHGRLPMWRHLRHTRRADARAIGYHYDVSNDFYGLWLDRQLVYSCAYFRTGEEDIDTAQEQKLEHICRKLMLRPGDRLLDIGCGWGALAIWAARHYGAQVTGSTLSRNQHDYARARVDDEGLAGRVDIRLQDYRDVPGHEVFDRIASIGMFEHVGLAKLPAYFSVIQRLLRPGGWVLNHGITSSDPDSRELSSGAGEFIRRHVFPDGELPHLSLAIREISRQGLEVTDVESLRPHYAQTLWHWASRLEAHQARAEAQAGTKRYRIWRLYLAGCAWAFDHGWINIHQILAQKPPEGGQSVAPWTREHIYDPAATTAPARVKATT